VDDPLATEAIRASAHFGYNPQATYIILTPPTTIGTGQPVYCGYHTQTTSVDGLRESISRAICLHSRSLTRAGRGSGTGGLRNEFGQRHQRQLRPRRSSTDTASSSATSNAEAVTDPDNFASNQDGWNDIQGVRTATSAPGPIWPTSP